jgi:succinate dehydrogenase/fumarate reductase flavoprotein subunit
MSSIKDATDDSAHSAAHASISEIREAGIRVTDKSPVMNTELISALQLEGLVSIAAAIADLG